MPVFYECQRCTACCRWPGQVYVTDPEITRLAEYKGMSEFDFIQKFTRIASDRNGLVLQDNVNGECIFLEGNNCVVQLVKPQQCSDFPNLWNFPGFEKICKAVPSRVEPAEYERLVKAATGRKIIPPEMLPKDPAEAG